MRNPILPAIATAFFLTACMSATEVEMPASGLTRPEIKMTTIQPYHPSTGIDVTTAVFDDLAHLNVSMVRIEFIADDVPGKPINYAAYDYIFKELHDRGIGVLGLIDYQSVEWENRDEWASDSFRERFVARTREIVSRYSQKSPPIRHWEIWNEQDIEVPNFDVRIEPEPYCQILVECYHAIKEIDPEALVVMGGISPKNFEYDDKPNYLRQMYESEALREHYEKHGYHPFDVVACHPYPEVFKNPTPLDPEAVGLDDVMNDKIKAVMNEFGDAEKKVWLTELGWNSAHSNEVNQATMLTRSFLLIDQLRDPANPQLPPYVDSYVWFKYDSWHPDEDWGLVTTQRGRKKPAYYAFEALTPTGPPAPTPVEPGENAPIWGETSDNALPHQVDPQDSLTGAIPQIVAGKLQDGSSLAALTDGEFRGDFALGADGASAGPLHLRYSYEVPVTVREVRVFAGQKEEGGRRAFQSIDILLNGTLVAEDVRTGNYGQTLPGADQAAVSMVNWIPEGSVPEAAAVETVDIVIWPTSALQGDFRDRWTPTADPERDIDGGGPAYISPMIREIDVIGR